MCILFEFLEGRGPFLLTIHVKISLTYCQWIVVSRQIGAIHLHLFIFRTIWFVQQLLCWLVALVCGTCYETDLQTLEVIQGSSVMSVKLQPLSS